MRSLAPLTIVSNGLYANIFEEVVMFVHGSLILLAAGDDQHLNVAEDLYRSVRRRPSKRERRRKQHSSEVRFVCLLKLEIILLAGNIFLISSKLTVLDKIMKEITIVMFGQLFSLKITSKSEILRFPENFQLCQKGFQ